MPVVLSPSVAPPALFQPGDRVHVKGQQREKALWTVVRRDYWRTDPEPAYMLTAGKGEDARTRFAFQSDMEMATGGRG